MLTAHHFTKSYGIHTVLQDISFSVSARERVGLIGPNGCEKTTIMRILAGIELSDQGTVAYTRPGLRIGYLAQGLELAPGQTIQSTHRQAQDDGLGLSTVSAEALESEITFLAATLSQNPGNYALQARNDSTLAQLAPFNVHPETILGPLGLGDFALETPVNHLSGGQKTRLMFARVLLNDPHLLLLDEPINHLDIPARARFEQSLAKFEGTLLTVVHDRYFIERFATDVWLMESGTIKKI